MTRKHFVLAASASALLTALLTVSPSPSYADTVTCDGMTATIVGTDSGETITGTAGADVIAALGGNDTVSGLGGDDRICGGGGDDTIYGDARIGNNRLVALLTGFSDTIDGGTSSSDFADAGPGTDTCTNTETTLNCEA
jgi:Ca2+-binding RTX toxin-like protein